MQIQNASAMTSFFPKLGEDLRCAIVSNLFSPQEIINLVRTCKKMYQFRVRVFNWSSSALEFKVNFLKTTYLTNNIVLEWVASHDNLIKLWNPRILRNAQEYIVSKVGFHSALKCFESSRTLNSLLNYGFDVLNSETNNLNLIDKINGHEFVNAFFNIKFKKDVPCIHVLLSRFICPLININYKSHASYKEAKKMIGALFKIIPEDYAFAEYYMKDGHACNDDIVDYYIERLEDVILDPEKEIYEEHVLSFIDKIESIPHPGLKMKVLNNILELLYEQNLDMKVFWPILYYVERHFGMEDVATGRLLSDIAENVNDFIEELDAFNLQEAEVVVNFLSSHPNWIEEHNLALPQVYDCVKELFELCELNFEIPLIIEKSSKKRPRFNIL